MHTQHDWDGGRLVLSCIAFLHPSFSFELFWLSITSQGQDFRFFSLLFQHNLKGIKIRIPNNRLHQ